MFAVVNMLVNIRNLCNNSTTFGGEQAERPWIGPPEEEQTVPRYLRSWSGFQVTNTQRSGHGAAVHVGGVGPISILSRRSHLMETRVDTATSLQPRTGAFQRQTFLTWASAASSNATRRWMSPAWSRRARYRIIQ